MLEALEIIRIRFSGRPLLLSLGLFAVIVTIRHFAGSKDRLVVSNRLARTVVWVSATVLLLTYAGIAIWYASDSHFFDNAEPMVTVVSWLFHEGQPVYPAVDAPERYAHIYGPMLYVVHGTALGLFGPHIVVSKAVGAFAGVTALVFVCAALRPHATAVSTIGFSGICALLFLLFRNYSFWTRPEPIQLLAVAGALFSTVRYDARRPGGGDWPPLYWLVCSQECSGT